MTVISQYQTARQLPVKSLVIQSYRIAQYAVELASERNSAERRLNCRPQIACEEQLAFKRGKKYLSVNRVALMVE